jgi:hypothetical protein
VRHWLNQVFAEYDRVRLANVIDAADSVSKQPRAKLAEFSPQRASS